MMNAFAFAQQLVSKLRARCPEAAPLRAQQARGAADVGIDDGGEFEPLLRLKNPSSAFNVMSLWVRHGRAWQPTFVRGTPAEIADKLAGPYAFLWRIHVLALDFDPAAQSRPPTRQPKTTKR